MDINFEKLNLVELAEDIERLFNPIALQKSLDFKIEIEKGLPDDIVSDRQRLQQIINNLLSNAFKFTDHGSVTMNICRPKESDIVKFGVKGDIKNLVSIEVKDTGSGINEEIMSRLFEKFSRRADSGAGLGLYIAKKIVDMHGGKIWVQNNRGSKGATFTFTLPLNEQTM